MKIGIGKLRPLAAAAMIFAIPASVFGQNCPPPTSYTPGIGCSFRAAPPAENSQPRETATNPAPSAAPATSDGGGEATTWTKFHNPGSSKVMSLPCKGGFVDGICRELVESPNATPEVAVEPERPREPAEQASSDPSDAEGQQVALPPAAPSRDSSGANGVSVCALSSGPGVDCAEKLPPQKTYSVELCTPQPFQGGSVLPGCEGWDGGKANQLSAEQKKKIAQDLARKVGKSSGQYESNVQGITGTRAAAIQQNAQTYQQGVLQQSAAQAQSTARAAPGECASLSQNLGYCPQNISSTQQMFGVGSSQDQQMRAACDTYRNQYNSVCR